jgi:hypothetical protein
MKDLIQESGATTNRCTYLFEDSEHFEDLHLKTLSSRLPS